MKPVSIEFELTPEGQEWLQNLMDEILPVPQHLLSRFFSAHDSRIIDVEREQRFRRTFGDGEDGSQD